MQYIRTLMIGVRSHSGCVARSLTVAHGETPYDLGPDSGEAKTSTRYQYCQCLREVVFLVRTDSL